MQDRPVVYLGGIFPEDSDKVTTTKRAGLGTRLKKFLTLLIGLIFLAGIPCVISLMFDIPWLMWLGGAIFVLAFTMFLFDKTYNGECPYCGHHFTIDKGEVLENNKSQVECPQCHEWLVMEGECLRSFRMEDSGELKGFQAPAFENGKWPAECICCGKPHVRFDMLKSTKLNASALLVGTVSTSSAKIFDVPYCAEHANELKLKIVDDHPRIVFPDLASQRRYLAVNSGSKPIKIK